MRGAPADRGRSWREMETYTAFFSLKGFEKQRVCRRNHRRVSGEAPPALTGGRPTPRRAPSEDHWGRRGVSVSLPEVSAGKQAGRRSPGARPACTGLHGHRGEPASRRNHPPKHRGWWGPSDGGSRMPIGQKMLVKGLPGWRNKVGRRLGAEPRTPALFTGLKSAHGNRSCVSKTRLVK